MKMNNEIGIIYSLQNRKFVKLDDEKKTLKNINIEKIKK